MKKVTIHTLLEKKQKKEPITWLTAYDFPMAQMEEKAEIDIILVGDSIGMTVFGYDSTLPVTMDLLIPHTPIRTALFHGEDGFPVRIVERLIELEFRIHGPPLIGITAVERLEEPVYLIQRDSQRVRLAHGQHCRI